MKRACSSDRRRLDVLLVERGLCETREKAQRAILAGEVLVNTERIDKPGRAVPADALVTVAARPRYVGRGGLKLEAALDFFGLDPSAQTALDIGASTGGFTDCLLQRGARRVYAVDVGHGQLDWKIRSDPRVVVREKCNARYLQPEDFPDPPTLAVIDVSFISLTMILPAACRVLQAGSPLVALIKPQFELGREEVSRGHGVIHDPESRARVVLGIQRFVEEDLRRHWRGAIASPVLGAEGNQEFLACLVN